MSSVYWNAAVLSKHAPLLVPHAFLNKAGAMTAPSTSEPIAGARPAIPQLAPKWGSPK